MTPGAPLCPGTGVDLGTFLGLGGESWPASPTSQDPPYSTPAGDGRRQPPVGSVTMVTRHNDRRAPAEAGALCTPRSRLRRELLLEPCRQHGLERDQQPGQAGGDADHGGADADRLVYADVLDEHRGDHHEGDTHGNDGPDGPPGRVLHSVPPASGYQWASPMSSAVDWSTIPVIGRPKSRW